jgi:hypothetical protein
MNDRTRRNPYRPDNKTGGSEAMNRSATMILMGCTAEEDTQCCV